MPATAASVTAQPFAVPCDVSAPSAAAREDGHARAGLAPADVKTTLRVSLAVQRYQTVRPPSVGSPACGFAPTVVPATRAGRTAMACAFAKSSLAGGSITSRSVPVAAFLPSTAT